MREAIEFATGGHQIYIARRPSYDTGASIPFRVSPKTLELDLQQVGKIYAIGQATTAFMMAVDGLYRSDERVKEIFDTGKPESLTKDTPAPRYLFIRPDLIYAPDGFKICEIETSPFGLALAEILNRAYAHAGQETLVQEDSLTSHVREHTGDHGDIVYSNRTSSYAGQMAFLAERIFSSKDRVWRASFASSRARDDHTEVSSIYRGFYLSEGLVDPDVAAVLRKAGGKSTDVLPSITPHMEEKAALALLWDDRYEGYFINELGRACVKYLRTVIPPTWIVGQEEHFSPGLPHGVERTEDIAALPASRRRLVLKPSGFSNNSSWSEGVHFLHKLSKKRLQAVLSGAVAYRSGLYVVQEFTKADGHSLPWTSKDGVSHQMDARIRITPYYSMAEKTAGSLVAIKATGCENTDYIHAGSASINTAVSMGSY